MNQPEFMAKVERLKRNQRELDELQKALSDAHSPKREEPEPYLGYCGASVPVSPEVAVQLMKAHRATLENEMADLHRALGITA